MALANSQGFTYCSAGTHSAVSNICERVEGLDIAASEGALFYDELYGFSLVADPDTSDLPVDDIGRRRKLIIRGFNLNNEVLIIKLLFENPELVDEEAELLTSIRQRHWHLAQTVTFWFFLALGHSRVSGRNIEPSDPIKIHKFKKLLDDMSEVSPLRDLASGKLGWSEYINEGQVSDSVLKSIVAKLLDFADLIFTTPARSCGEGFASAKARAKAIVLDEAAGMHRADAYCVHGNTLLPCLLAGDEKQLGTHVAAGRLKDTNGHALNRHSQDGEMSLLEFYQGHDFPVARLKQQLRMANGLFDMAAELFYPELVFAYGEQSNITLPKHEPGRLLEQFAQDRFPGLRPAPPDKLMPIFLHCVGKTFIHPVTFSKRNVKQTLYALDFLVDFIATTGVDAANLVILTPYSFNLEFVNRALKRPQYASLRRSGEACTVDTFQGREGALVVYITVSTLESGPGFISENRRLNVALTRQVSGLVIVGDINVSGKIVGKDGRFWASKRSARELKSIMRHLSNGELIFQKCHQLRELVKIMMESGRVAMAWIEGDDGREDADPDEMDVN